MSHVSSRLWVAGIVLASMLASSAWAQDAETPAADVTPAATATEEPAADAAAPTLDAPATTEGDAAAPADEQPDASDVAAPDASPPTDLNAETTTEETSVPPIEQGADAAADAVADDGGAATLESPKKLSSAMLALLIVAIIVLPVIIGNSLAKNLKMPDHGWKISTVLMTVLASAAVCTFGTFKGGPDLAGGITLIYELDESAGELVGKDEQETADGDLTTPGSKRKVSTDKMIAALKQRVDPTSTKEVTIRPYGPDIEIIIPKAGQDELQLIKDTITRLGELEFRITADANRPEMSRIVELAKALPPAQTRVLQNGEPAAEWVLYKEAEFGPLDDPDRGLVKRQGIDGPEALVLLDNLNVTGQYLTSARKNTGPQGWQVDFSFNAVGANRFGRLTGRHLPTSGSGRPYYLGILLDKTLLSAPSINARITTSGTISGSLTEKEVDEIVAVLDAGSLPAALNKTPVSENSISPTIGLQTIQRSKAAIALSMLLVVLFMIFYYRMSGLIAVVALVLNLLILVAVMVAIGAAFTLPGLAGIVLTVGMAVDANVLIYERLREEMAKGTTLRMAIRNAFDRAFATIVDANVTTLIVGIVLYVIGTDQIKGFAVTLVIGIVVSMFTAVFCARLIFDIAERRGWITKLSMSQIIGHTNIDFMGYAPALMGLSAVLIAIGLAAVWQRGSGMLNIDFTGGTSVTLALREDSPMTFGEIREALSQTELAEKNLQVVARGESGLSYTVDTSERSVEGTQAAITEALGDRLARYDVTYTDVAPYTDESGTGTSARVSFGPAGDDLRAVGFQTVESELIAALAATGHEGVKPLVSNAAYRPGSSQRFTDWDVKLPTIAEADAPAVLDAMKTKLGAQPVFPLANMIGGRVASNLQTTALYSMLISFVGIIVYVWFRFDKLIYGIAGVVALIHDVLAALGLLAITKWIVDYMPGVADALMLDSFQLSLPVVAAFLTLVGYSINDTIVIFDRIREIRGKSPVVTKDIINVALNQTLSRTILTALTVFIVVLVLYIAGGEDIHGFAFVLFVGVIVGCYSSLAIAAPIVLWLQGSAPKSTLSSRQPALAR